MALTGGSPQQDCEDAQDFAGLESSGFDLTDPETRRQVETGAALVERYAPRAPLAIKDEAIVRVAGYLQESPPSNVRMEKTGEITTSYHRDMGSALRHSGAMALLSPWKVRRGGAI